MTGSVANIGAIKLGTPPRVPGGGSPSGDFDSILDGTTAPAAPAASVPTATMPVASVTTTATPPVPAQTVAPASLPSVRNGVRQLPAVVQDPAAMRQAAAPTGKGVPPVTLPATVDGEDTDDTDSATEAATPAASLMGSINAATMIVPPIALAPAEPKPLPATAASGAPSLAAGPLLRPPIAIIPSPAEAGATSSAATLTGDPAAASFASVPVPPEAATSTGLAPSPVSTPSSGTTAIAAPAGQTAPVSIPITDRLAAQSPAASVAATGAAAATQATTQTVAERTSTVAAASSLPSTVSVLGTRGTTAATRRVALAEADGGSPLSGVAATLLGGGTADVVGTAATAGTGQPATADSLDTRDPTWLTQLANRIAEAGARSGQASIRLSPDALGAVAVSVRRVAGRLSVSLDASDPQARQMLVDAQPQLIALAQSRGIALDSATVTGGGAGDASAQTASAFFGNQAGGGDPSRSQSAPRQPAGRPATSAEDRFASAEPTTSDRLA